MIQKGIIMKKYFLIMLSVIVVNALIIALIQSGTGFRPKGFNNNSYVYNQPIDTRVNTYNAPKAVTSNNSGCTKFAAAYNQQAAFENLGLNYHKTKKWGAFVDVYGNLRANKPSCRLIKRGSEEYNRYK